MKIFHIIIAFISTGSLFSETVDQLLITDSPVEISLMDTSGLDPKLKQFLYKFYQKNYSGNEYIKKVKSMQFFGSYSVNGEEAGSIKLIKKRPNKYKSHIKNKNGTEEIIIYDGKKLQKRETNNSDPSIQWHILETDAPENFWIHYDQLFDSVMLNPKDPNKKMSLGKAHLEDGQVIQPITIELENEIKITNFVAVRDNLIIRALIEYYHTEDPNYKSYTIYYDNYVSENGILFPKKITTEINEETIIVTEFSEIQLNSGISDFFFKATSL